MKEWRIIQGARECKAKIQSIRMNHPPIWNPKEKRINNITYNQPIGYKIY
jgi:hypothetical protein